MGEEKEIWTPLKIVQWAVPFLTQKGLPNARFDAETLIAYALGLDRLKVYLQFDRPLDPEELSKIRELMKRRARHEPIQYIIGKKEFFGLPIKVSPSVLIPRPETELLVEKALEYLKMVPEKDRLVLDLGTGSGCIGLSIVKSLDCRVWAVDISEKALEMARENALSLGVEDRVEWRKGDWFSALLPTDPSQFCLVVSNPPYIANEEEAELAKEIRDFEPREALFAGNNGLSAYQSIAEHLLNSLKPGGKGLLEIHSGRLQPISDLFHRGNKDKTFYRDLQGLPRVLEINKGIS